MSVPEQGDARNALMRVCSVDPDHPEQDWSSVMRIVAAQTERQIKLAEKLVKRDPVLGFSAFIIAGDILSAEEATRRVKEDGWEPEDALGYVGSYKTLDWAYKHLPRARLIEKLPTLWPQCDPDDRDPRFKKLWHRAWELNGRNVIIDDRTCPSSKRLRVYRGQMPGDDLGISWTLEKRIARRFQKNAGLRHTVKGGLILTGHIKRSLVYGYMTGRGEAEIVCDPENIQGVEVWVR